MLLQLFLSEFQLLPHSVQYRLHVQYTVSNAPLYCICEDIAHGTHCHMHVIHPVIHQYMYTSIAYNVFLESLIYKHINTCAIGYQPLCMNAKSSVRDQTACCLHYTHTHTHTHTYTHTCTFVLSFSLDNTLSIYNK